MSNAPGTIASNEHSTKKFNVTTELALLITYLIMITVFSITSPFFLSVNNFLNIGLYSAIMGIVTTGMTLALLSGGFDISVGSTTALVGMVVATSLPDKGSMIPSVLFGLAVALGCGLFNGLLITKAKINPLITTLATMTIFRGFAYIYTNGVSVQISNSVFKDMGRGYLLGIPFPLVVMAVVFAIFWFILKYTMFGRQVYSVGGNSQASYLSGINVGRVRLIIYTLCGLTAGISGVLLSAQAGAGLPQASGDLAMESIAAVILGGTSLSGGKGNILGSLLGVLILSTLSNGLTLLNVPAFYQMVIKGFVLIFAVLSDVIRGGSYK